MSGQGEHGEMERFNDRKLCSGKLAIAVGGHSIITSHLRGGGVMPSMTLCNRGETDV